ncbi:MAG: 16S rRNA (adenine(1518)-N(6)/adenine(1519)-N(6))-dimethyltransferase RsmA [Deltaproteobacteria bacterium]|jgi:16S rRNA (adenine1518-N6/adenine1519-N6)-dimethyltransferase|nr:16S rRNA (adenine(1518)-N(6)/adenine(1519)-N(6))-dimethyltransferase RsmA [Deltaproteobacteria bacterium]
MTAFSHPEAKKSLGQNFLQDCNLARKIVERLQIEPEDQVWEIGPGPGMLTGFLIRAAPAALTLLEKDIYWSAIRRAEGEKQSALSLTVITGDALRQDWAALKDPFKIIGNLPYNIASPLMWNLFSRARGLRRAVFMVQKEVALRVIAPPACGQYGSLSIWLQSFCRPRLEFMVPPQVFRPRPKVWSAVLSFEPLSQGSLPAHPEALSYLLKIFFQQRRKQIGVIFRRQGHDPALLTKCGIALSARPEELSPVCYKELSDIFYRENCI